MRQLLMRVIAAAVTFACALPLTALAQIAQTPTAKALVYCPATIDSSGCDHIVTALSGTFAAVDRAYDGTNGTINLASADINHYAVFLVPSLADGAAKPYALLRDPAIAARLKTVTTGRIALWSGTPDQGDANRDLKDRLIQNLVSWAGQPYAAAGVMGTVILQDFSSDPTQRYGWLSGISSIAVAADTSLDVYDNVAVLTPAAKTILDNGGVQLAYASMASYGLHFPNGNAPLAGALGGSSNRQIVLATYDGATDGIANVTTDKSDYMPGETATITGSGWAPGETVSMVLHEDPEVHENRTLTSIADDQGNFVNTQFVLEPHDLGVKFLLTALGATSGRSAQTTFTDGNSTVSGTIKSVSGSPIAGATITCSTGCNGTFTTTSGGNGTYSLPLSFAGNAGATVILTASATAFTTNTRTVTIPPNSSTVTGMDISLTPTTSIVVPNASGNFGAATNLSATLTSGSNPVGGKSIGFKLNGTSVGTATTNAAGVASLNVSLSGIAVGTYTGGINATFGGDAGFTGSTGTGSLTVTPASQTIVFTSTPPANAVFGGPSYAVTATGGASGNAVTFSIQSGSSCTLTTPNIVNMTAAGNCTVIASQAGNSNYAAAPNVQQTFIIGKASQTISFASLSPKTLGDAPFTVSATASSGLPVSFAVGATDQCTIAATTVSITGVGSCTVTASQAGNANYDVAPNVAQTVSISPAQATVSITSDTPDPSQYGQPVTVQFSVTGPPSTPTPTGTVSISDGTVGCSATVAAGSCSVTFTTVGPTTLTATYSGDANFVKSASAGEAHQVSKAATHTVITAHTPDPVTFGQPITISVSVSAATATPPGGSVAVSLIGDADRATCNAPLTNGAGSCTLTPPSVGAKIILATYPGDANYNESTSQSVTQQVGQSSQTITFAALPDKKLGDAAFSVSATASSGLPVSFAVGATDQCTIAGSTVTVTAAGSCTVTASQSGNATYAPAANVSQTFAIAKGDATVAITADTPDPSQYGEAISVAFTVTPPAGTPVPTGNVTVSDGTASCTATAAAGSCSLTPVTAGAKTLTATYAGDANYGTSVSAGEPHQVNKAAVHTLITAHTPDPVPLGQPLTITVSVTPLTATASPPGGGVAVSLLGPTPADYASCNATLTNGVGSCSLTPPTAGSRTLQATFPGDANYGENTSPSVTQQVGQSPQTITFAALPNKSFGDAPFTVSATASSGLPVAFAVGATDQCTIAGSTVSLTGAGSCTVTASQAGNATYQPAPSESQIFQIGKASSAIAITSQTPSPSQVGQAVIIAYAVTGVTGGITPAGSVTVGDGTASCTATVAAGACSLTLTSAGPKTLTATYGGDNNYLTSVSPGTPHQVNPASQTITFAALLNKKVTDPPFTVSATASSGLAVSFAVGAADQCTILGNTVTITGAGSCTVTAAQAGNADFAAAPNVSQTFTITKAPATVAITADTPDPSQFGQVVNVAFTVSGGAGAPAPTGNVTVSDGSASCTATVAAGSCGVTLATIGARTLTATYGGDANFESGVSPGEPHQVNKGAVQTLITAHTPDPAVVGQPVTVNVSVSSATAPSPAGSVAVSLLGPTPADNASCNAALTNGVGSCSLTPPTAGSRTLQATFPGDANYFENSSPVVTVLVNKAPASVTLVASTLNQTYDGNAKSVQATTSVTGLNVVIGYSQNGVAVSAPTAAGSYDVTATIQDPNYSGGTTGTLVIGKATATLTIAGVSHSYNGAPQGVTVTTSPAGLTGVSVSYAGVATTPTNAGSYPVTATLDNPNYAANPATATLTIAKATATVTVSNLEQTYDGTGKVPTVSTTPPNLHVTLLFGEGGVSSTNPVNAGSYPFVATIDDNNYDGSANGTLVIDKAIATLALSDLSRSYDGAAKVPTVTSVPAGLSGVSITYNSIPTPPITVGSYAVLASLSNVNYTAAPASGTLVIGKATTTTTITSHTPSPSSYGQGVDVAVSVASPGGVTPGTVTVSDGTTTCSATVAADGSASCRITPTSVGTKTLTAAYGGDENHEGSTSAAVTHDVTKAAVQSVVTSHAPSPSVFGEAVTVSVSVTSLTTGTPTGSVAISLVGDAATCNAVLANGIGSCSLVPQSVGAKTINATFPGDANFNQNTSAPVSHTVEKATASITFGNLNQTYDGSPKIVTAVTTPANLSGLTITYGGSPTPPTNAGSYAISATLDNPNYNLAPASATLTVNPGPQSITFAPLTPKSYGDAAFAVTATASSGLTVAFSAAGQCTVAGGQVTITGAGTCSITASQPGSGNFAAAPDITRSFTIAKAALNASANSAQMVYGDALPLLSGAVTGVVNGDGITAVFTTAAVPASPVGSYPIVPQLQDPNGKLTNYTVVLTNGALTITPADLSATANDATRVYGAANPPFSGTLTGLRNNDAITLSFSTTATLQSNAGTYSIVPSLDDPNSKLGNYTVRSLTNGTLTITKATATLSLSNLSQVYTGNPLPVTVTTTPGGLSGVSVTYNGLTTVPTDAGQYALVATLTNDNYSAAQVTGTLSIAQASQTITLVTPAAATYGDPPIGVTASATSGLPVAIAVTGSCTVSAFTVTITGAGTCTVTASQAGNNNFNAASNVSHSFTIAKGNQTISFTQPSPMLIGTSASIIGSASANTGLPVTYASASPDRCSVTADGTVSVIDVGVGAAACTITASQAGNANYNGATATTRIDLLNKLDGIINNANNTLSWSSTTTYFTVAILTVKRADGTIMFDASRVDPSTVTLSSLHGTTGVIVDAKGQLKMAMIDVNLDGAADMVLYFTKSAVFGSGDVGQSLTVTLNGTLKTVAGDATRDGRPIRGNDKIQITP